jgi:hypothetical protein
MRMDDTICEICGKPFTEQEWEDRHTDPATGEDCHERCCPMCKPKLRNIAGDAMPSRITHGKKRTKTQNMTGRV